MKTLNDVLAYNRELRDTLQLLWDSITAKGQKKKALKNNQLKSLLLKYGVDISDAE